MRVIGVELTGSDMVYVIVTNRFGDPMVEASGKITLGRDTRDAGALAVFQTAVKGILAEHQPDRVAMKQKPERGQYAAGPAALKMEALLLATADCGVVFVSGRKTKAEVLDGFGFRKYEQDALASALVVLGSGT